MTSHLSTTQVLVQCHSCSQVKSHSPLSPNSNHPPTVMESVRYLDVGTETVISLRVQDLRPHSDLTPPRFWVHFGHRTKFQFHTTKNVTTHVTQLSVGPPSYKCLDTYVFTNQIFHFPSVFQLHMKHNQSDDRVNTPVSIRPVGASLSCPVPSVTYSVRQSCDPQTRIFVRYPGIEDYSVFLHGAVLDKNGRNP